MCASVIHIDIMILVSELGDQQAEQPSVRVLVCMVVDASRLLPFRTRLQPDVPNFRNLSRID